MQPPAIASKQRKPIGRKVEEEPDDDPDFRRGPIDIPVEKKAPEKRSGKKRKDSKPAAAAPNRPNKRRKLGRNQAAWDRTHNPLIELLGVQDDDYFQDWDSPDEKDKKSVGFDRESIEDKDIRDVLLSAPSNIEQSMNADGDGSVTDIDDSETEDDDDVSPRDSRSKLKLEETDEWVAPPKYDKTIAEKKKEARDRKRLEDPDATESDSDSDPIKNARNKAHNNAASKEPRDSTTKPCLQIVPYTGPYVLDYSKGIQVPGSINKYLRPYQREGIKFLWDQYDNKRGGILGDDMGLGKTVQVISFLSAIMKKQANSDDIGRRYNDVDRMLCEGYVLPTLTIPKPTHPLPRPNQKWPTCLLVCPLSLLANWKNELETWGYFEFEVFESGDKQKQNAIIRNFRLGRLDMVLVSFDMLHQRPELVEQHWSLVIVDEVHGVKNRRSERYKGLSKFKRSIRRFGLTGTAIQNNYEELWTLLHWSNPGKVGTEKQWKRSISEPLKKGQSNRATLEEQQRREVVADNLVTKLLPHFFLRRDKTVLAGQLPKKIDMVAFCPLTEKQQEAYANVLDSPQMQDILEKDEPCDCGEGEKRSKCCHPVDASVLLQHISIFIKISNSLALICSGPRDSAEEREMNQDIQERAFPGQNIALAILSHQMSQEEYSGKWKVLNGLLKKWHDENAKMDRLEQEDDQRRVAFRHKVLVFTKSKKLLGIIGDVLEYEGYDTCRLHGDLKADERQQNIQRFREDKNAFVFLITTQAGGVGLNLTAANKVIIFDPSWNPANDLQAMDRAYRFGQNQDVEVYRLLSRGCIEELIYKRQIYKQQMMRIGYEASTQTRLFDGIQGVKDNEGELFGVRNLFALSETSDTGEKIEQAMLDEDIWRLKAKDEKGKGGSDGTESGMFDLIADSPEDVANKREKLKKVLESLGVDHSHSNQDLLKPSMKEKASLHPQREPKKRNSDEAKRPLFYTAPPRASEKPVKMVLSDSD